MKKPLSCCTSPPPASQHWRPSRAAASSPLPHCCRMHAPLAWHFYKARSPHRAEYTEAAPEMLAEPGCHSRAVVLLRIPPGPPCKPPWLPLPPAPPVQVLGAFPPLAARRRASPVQPGGAPSPMGAAEHVPAAPSAHVLRREACPAAGVQRQAFAGSFTIKLSICQPATLPALLPSPSARPPFPPVSAAPCMPLPACLLKLDL